MEKTTWGRLDAGLRAELERLLAAPTAAFESDYQDLLAWWLLLLIAGAGGIGAALWDISTDSLSLGETVQMVADYPLALVTSPRNLGLLAALAITPWAAYSMVSRKGRCGFAALSSALVVVRGPKLKLVRYENIASASTRVIRTRKQSFTVLTLKLKDGGSKDLNVHGAWAKEVQDRLGHA